MQSFSTQKMTLKFVKPVLKFKKEWKEEKGCKKERFVPEQIDAQEVFKIHKNKGDVGATQL